MKILTLCLATLLTTALLTGCAEPPPPAAEPAPSNQEMPPGFLDEPPAPPTSSTQVLSGGTLVTDGIIEDSVVVLNDGKLVSWGKRGEVEMPNDSVGFDLRGKWITPGTWEDATTGNLPLNGALQPGDVANFLILREPPPFDQLEESDLGGRVTQGELELFDSPAD